jgi:hypothetical protein
MLKKENINCNFLELKEKGAERKRFWNFKRKNEAERNKKLKTKS